MEVCEEMSMSVLRLDLSSLLRADAIHTGMSHLWSLELIVFAGSLACFQQLRPDYGHLPSVSISTCTPPPLQADLTRNEQ